MPSAITDSAVLYQDEWISDQGWANILTRHYPGKVKDIKDLRATVVRTLNSLAGTFDSSNINKVYVAKFSTQCPFTKTDRMVHYYCRGINELPKQPSAASGVHCAYLRSLIMSENRARGMPTIVDLDTRSRRNDKLTDATPRRSQRGKYTVPCITVTPTRTDSDEEDEDNEEEEEGANVATQPIYWSSPEAAKLFGCNYNAGDDPYELLEERIELLENAFDHYNGYKEVVTGEGEVYQISKSIASYKNVSISEMEVRC
jgi:hypothetical protein